MQQQEDEIITNDMLRYAKLCKVKNLDWLTAFNAAPYRPSLSTWYIFYNLLPPVTPNPIVDKATHTLVTMAKGIIKVLAVTLISEEANNVLFFNWANQEFDILAKTKVISLIG